MAKCFLYFIWVVSFLYNNQFYSQPASTGFVISINAIIFIQVLDLVPKEAERESFEDALARVRRCLGGGDTTENADSDSDLEVVAESVTVNLRCPVSFLVHNC